MPEALHPGTTDDPEEELLQREAHTRLRTLLTVIQACPDDLLNDPRRLGLPAEVVPWTLVAANSFEHYQQHARAIRAWLDPASGPHVRASHSTGGMEVVP